MKLHENSQLFNQSIRATAQQMGIAEIYVEKDYWVTLALKTLFSSYIAKDTVFKGGTALSKCFGVIERFSEDIDLVMVEHEEEGTSKMERKVKQPSKVIASVLPEIEVQGLTHKKGMLRKTVHQYNKAFTGVFGQVRDVIVLEASYLGRYEPFHHQKINSYIGNMVQNVGQQQIAQAYELLPFTVQVMHVNRTICEKIMSLVRFSYGEDPVQQLKNKIRHTYDIYQLLQQKEIANFVASNAFDVMLLNVAEDDKRSFKTNNNWLANHPNQSLLFSNPQEVWNQLKNTYVNDFSNLVYGKLPEEKEIVKTLIMLQERMGNMTWAIDIKN